MSASSVWLLAWALRCRGWTPIGWMLPVWHLFRRAAGHSPSSSARVRLGASRMKRNATHCSCMPRSGAVRAGCRRPQVQHAAGEAWVQEQREQRYRQLELREAIERAEASELAALSGAPTLLDNANFSRLLQAPPGNCFSLCWCFLWLCCALGAAHASV